MAQDGFMKKIVFLVVIFLTLADHATAEEQTFHFRGDSHTVNGLNAYKLEEGQSDIAADCVISVGDMLSCFYNSDVYIRHVDGTEIQLGSFIAQTSRSGGEGYQDGTWNCTEISLEPTDAIKIVERVKIGTITDAKTWITKQLGWTKLKTGTWTFHRYTASGIRMISSSPPRFITFGAIGHGTVEHDAQLQGILYSAHLDMGIRVKTDESIIKIGALSNTDTDKLRIRINNITYGIPLLAVDDPSASPIRIFDGVSIMALPKID